jgi:hypothetical protein
LICQLNRQGIKLWALDRVFQNQHRGADRGLMPADQPFVLELIQSNHSLWLGISFGMEWQPLGH